ncbi:F-box protein At5g06550 [Impatiens glandulifera]|uniref:F-box protein At5g06550 n=1 Tax=Impatiens glandulifera TaxID=253017 RepID=UPI001FB05CF1|nr:F-box protein At5g06550 [Impatiens glandulifera]
MMLGYKNLLLRSSRHRKRRRNDSKSKSTTTQSKKIFVAETKQSSNFATKVAEEEEGEEEVGFSLKTCHYNNHVVQPLGNLYFIPNLRNCRDTGLGNLQKLTDELVLDILGLLGGTHLGILSTVSKSFYVFCNHEPIWRNLVLENYNGEFLYNGSWKSTFIATFSPSFSLSRSVPTCLKVRDFFSDYLFQSWLCANLEMKPEWLERDNIQRRRGISVDDFVKNFEEPNKPVLLEGCMDNWVAFKKWDKDYLVKTCGSVKFSVGPVEMKLDDFFMYSEQAKEERPLYLFDSSFVKKVPELGSGYEIPEYFREDLFGILGNERPDYRWIIVGPAGSGSSFHIDPNSTSAWNAVIRGSKKWVLFPPDVVPPGVHPSPDGAEVASPVSITEWFMNFYEETKQWKKRPIECVCKAGEVIFVPNGWWHLVFNLEDSIAITQNFVSRRNLLNVLDFIQRPNAKNLVSGTRDRVNLHDNFKAAIETSFPGTIAELMSKEAEKIAQLKKPTFWEAASDAKGGAFKFSF